MCLGLGWGWGWHAVGPVWALRWDVFADHSGAVLLLRIVCVVSVLFLLCLRACLFINALWSPAGKG